MNSASFDCPNPSSRILHVAQSGDGDQTGSIETPFHNISAAADVALPGDTVRVHAGIYRERINPPRGGISDTERITYEAADGEEVEIRGSEVIKDWEHQGNGIWQAEISNAIFEDVNPFSEQICGDWFLNMGRRHHTAAVFINGRELHESNIKDSLQDNFWYAEVDQEFTRLWVNAGSDDLNAKMVEVNVRPTIFYPSKTRINYITLRGFTFQHAATNWAPPSAEQIGMIGTNWSKGWMIEHNTVRYSRCVGISLGKHGDAFDNTSANSAEGYTSTIARAHARRWDRENVGSHCVRKNVISHCEQAGIVGSLGAIFSEITDNVIHDIHVHRFFNGAEQAAIKFHAPIDTLIAGNHIYRSHRGLWMDWMTQGTRITRNLCHDNLEQDLFVEVNHGPFLVDHNLFLSNMSIWSISHGGAFVHNLIGGKISRFAEYGRETPWHPAHSTEVAGMSNIRGGDERYFNNLFLLPSAVKAAEGKLDEIWGEENGLEEALKAFENFLQDNQMLTTVPELIEQEDGYDLIWNLNRKDLPLCAEVTTESLGITAVAKLPYVNYDGKPLVFDKDYSGASRTADNCMAGPFVSPSEPVGQIRVYEKQQATVRSEKIMVV